MPWRGYVLWVGGTLLMLLLAINALLPPPAASRYFSASARLPTVRIHSEVKGPGKVTIDTSGFVRREFRTGLLAASEQNAFAGTGSELPTTSSRPKHPQASGGASATRSVAGLRETLAQLAPQAEVAPVKQASRRHPSHPGRGRSRKTQPHRAALPELRL